VGGNRSDLENSTMTVLPGGESGYSPILQSLATWEFSHQRRWLVPPLRDLFKLFSEKTYIPRPVARRLGEKLDAMYVHTCARSQLPPSLQLLKAYLTYLATSNYLATTHHRAEIQDRRKVSASHLPTWLAGMPIAGHGRGKQLLVPIDDVHVHPARIGPPLLSPLHESRLIKPLSP
jgi:hypothetical protein